MSLSLIELARMTDALHYQASIAKAVAPYDHEESARHLKNVITIHEQIGKLLASAKKDAA